ncbi:serine/threonine-protein kinase Chk1-like [Oratosquilla oratoria]|uniref:serine/threonine-protein kinase Chk1-like n=1 Tax=Oratosquilla oratoria TaxID=337810 RepID=UPI003F7655D4
MIFWLFSSCLRRPGDGNRNAKKEDSIFKKFLQCFRCGTTSSEDDSTPDEGILPPVESTVIFPLTAQDVQEAVKENETTVLRYTRARTWTRVRVLGKGAFGTATLLENVSTKELVARKVVTKALNSDDLKAEEVIQSRMRHENVARLFAWHSTGSKRFLYMEHCPRGDLRTYIQFHVISLKRAYYFFGQLVKGVEYLHARGVAHRDLTPRNVLLAEDKTLKISDFGSSDVFIIDGEEFLLTGQVGEYAYMAPEVLVTPESRYLGPPVDFWSCGIILFNMLTMGSRPWGRAVPENGEYKMWAEKDPRIEGLRGWNKLNPDSRALLEVLLEPDPV